MLCVMRWVYGLMAILATIISCVGGFYCHSINFLCVARDHLITPNFTYNYYQFSTVNEQQQKKEQFDNLCIDTEQPALSGGVVVAKKSKTRQNETRAYIYALQFSVCVSMCNLLANIQRENHYTKYRLKINCKILFSVVRLSHSLPFNLNKRETKMTIFLQMIFFICRWSFMHSISVLILQNVITAQLQTHLFLHAWKTGNFITWVLNYDL